MTHDRNQVDSWNLKYYNWYDCDYDPSGQFEVKYDLVNPKKKIEDL